MLSTILRLNFYCLNIFDTLHQRYRSKNDRIYSKKISKRACVHDITKLIIMKAQLMKKFSNTEAELKKCVAYKKGRIPLSVKGYLR